MCLHPSTPLALEYTGCIGIIESTIFKLSINLKAYLTSSSFTSSGGEHFFKQVVSTCCFYRYNTPCIEWYILKNLLGNRKRNRFKLTISLAILFFLYVVHIVGTLLWAEFRYPYLLIINYETLLGILHRLQNTLDLINSSYG